MVNYDWSETTLTELRARFSRNRAAFQDGVRDAQKLQKEMDALTDDFQRIADMSVKLTKRSVTLLRKFD